MSRMMMRDPQVPPPVNVSMTSEKVYPWRASIQDRSSSMHRSVAAVSSAIPMTILGALSVSEPSCMCLGKKVERGL